MIEEIRGHKREGKREEGGGKGEKRGEAEKRGEREKGQGKGSEE